MFWRGKAGRAKKGLRCNRLQRERLALLRCQLFQALGFVIRCVWGLRAAVDCRLPWFDWFQG